MGAYASAATPPSATPPVAEPEPGKDESHERLLFLLSKIDALPKIQTIQWIPRGLDRRYAAVRLQTLDRAIQAAKANTAASTQKLWTKVALLIPHLILRMKPGYKEQEDGQGSIRDEIRKRLAMAEKGATTEGSHRRPGKRKIAKEKKNEGPGTTDKEDDSFRRAAEAADRGQLRTAARLLRGSKLLPPTEATADAIEQLYQTSNEAQRRTDAAFIAAPLSPKCDVRQQHVLTHIRDAKRQAHPGPSGERNSHIASPLVSPRGLTVLTQWVQLCPDKKLDPAFTEPWLQAKVIGGDKGGGKARPIAFEEMLLKLVTSSILRAHVSQVRRAAGSYQYGIYHEGGAPEIAWKIHAKMAAEPTKVFIACGIKNGFGAARRSDAVEGAKRRCPVLGTIFANLWAGKGVQPTAWLNTPREDRPIRVRDGFLQGACEVPVAFALALRVALAEFEDEM